MCLRSSCRAVLFTDWFRVGRGVRVCVCVGVCVYAIRRTTSIEPKNPLTLVVVVVVVCFVRCPCLLAAFGLSDLLHECAVANRMCGAFAGRPSAQNWNCLPSVCVVVVKFCASLAAFYGCRVGVEPPSRFQLTNGPEERPSTASHNLRHRTRSRKMQIHGMCVAYVFGSRTIPRFIWYMQCI